MQIFVSWSGKPAQVLADFLQTWLRQVIQELDPFMSTNSIEKGARWSPEISKRLEETAEAIVCVTSENQDAPWLNFEAGALAKATDSRVRPLLIDLAPSDVTGPLSEFQLTSAADKDDVRRLLNSINERCDRSLPGTILDSTFNREWPALEAKIAEVVAIIGGQPGKTPRKREDVDLMAEILDRVRMVERLTQEHLYISERLYGETMGQRVPPRPNQPRVSEMARSEQSNLERFHKFLRGMDARQRLRITDHKNQNYEGKILAFKGEMPDTAVLIGDQESTAAVVEIVSIAAVQLIDDSGDPI